MVVEDEYFIASDLKRQLAGEGAEVVGPVATLEAGLRLADEPLDAAVLDVNLEEDLSYPIAERLRARDVPFLLLTGYDAWSLPPEYRSAPRLAKPFAPGAVAAAVAALASAG
jgi:DNA-binding response OmpR family regulator